MGGHLNAIEIKAFVPARDFALSRRFYEDLGFTTAWSDSDLAYLRCGDCSFLLQNFYHSEHAGNFMMHMLVADLVATRGRLSAGHEIRGARRTAGGPALGHARLHDYRPDRGTLADRTKLRVEDSSAWRASVMPMWRSTQADVQRSDTSNLRHRGHVMAIARLSQLGGNLSSCPRQG